MTAVALVQHFQQAGFSLQLNSQGLAISPASRLSDTDRALIKEHKSRLIDFLTSANQSVEAFSEYLESNPSKPTKPDFTKNIEDTSSNEICLTCNSQLLSDNPRHFWCPAGHLDRWLPVGSVATVIPAQLVESSKSGKQLALEAIQNGECPGCGEVMTYRNGVRFHDECQIKVIGAKIYWRGELFIDAGSN